MRPFLLFCLISIISCNELMAQCGTTSNIAGNNNTCANTNGAAYSVTNNSGSTYAWTITGGTQASGGNTNSITVNWEAAGAGQISVVENFSDGCIGNRNLAVTINSIPSTSVIVGNSNVCSNTLAVTYSAQTSGSLTGRTFSWIITGGIQASGTIGNSITVNWGGAGLGNVRFIEKNGSGCFGIPVDLPIIINAPPVISAPSANLCAATTMQLSPNTGGSWSATFFPGSSSIVTSAGLVTAGNSMQNQSFKFTQTSTGCSNSLSVNIIAKPITSIISGPSKVCINSTGITYGVGNRTGSTYVWTVTGGTQTSGSNTSVITIDWGATGAGNVSVIETNSTGCIGVEKNLPVTIYNYPIASAITGNPNVCPLPASYFTTTYSVPNTSGSTYVWSIIGGNIISGNGTNSIITSWPVAGTGNVSVVETNSAGCAGIAVTKTVNISAPATSDITGNTSVCSNSNGVSYSVVNTTGSTYAWTITGGIQVSGTNTNSITVNWGATGSGNVSVIENTTGCIGVAKNLPVTIYSYPSTAAIMGNPNACPGPASYFTTTYSVPNTSGSTYVWSIIGGNIISGNGTNSIITSWPVAGTGNVSVVETNPAGCAGIAITKAVNIIAPATSDITGNTSICPNSNGIPYSVVNTTGSTYAWTITGGIQVSGTNTNSITVNWGAPGAGNVSVIETNSTGCIGVAQNLLVTIYSYPTTAAIMGNPNACPGPASHFTTTYSVPNTSGSTYVWSIIGGNIISGNGTNNIITSWPVAGTGNVSVVETNPAGCAGIAVTKAVNISAPATSDITGNTNICPNSNGISYSVVNTTGSTYAWTITGGIQVSGTNTNSITVNWGATGAGNVSVIETNSNGCVGVLINSPVINNCQPIVRSLTENTLTGNSFVTYSTDPGMTNYQWSVSQGGVISSGGNGGSSFVKVIWTSTSPQTVSVNYTDANNYISPSPTIINVNVSLTPPTLLGSFCLDSTDKVYVTEAGKSKYNWSVSGGTIITGGTSSSNTITVRWSASGGSIGVSYKNIDGSLSPYFIRDIVPTAPQTPSGSTSACIGSTQNHFIASSGGGIANYNWSVSSGGTITAGGLSTDSYATITWNAPGNQSVNLSYANSDGCITPVGTTNVQVYQPVPTITGNVITTVNTNTTYTTEPGMYNYTWISPNSSIVSGYSTNALTLQWGSVGPQTLSVSYRDSHGCVVTSPTIKNITVTNPIVSGPAQICSGSINTFSTETGMSNYSWSVSPDGTITNNGTASAQITWNTPGEKTIRVSYTNALGNTSTSFPFYTMVNAFPIPVISGNSTGCAGTPVTYNTQANNYNYLWNIPADGTITSGSPTSNAVTVTWNSGGTKTISVNYSNSIGCTAPSSTKMDIVVSQPVIPTLTGISEKCFNASSDTFITEAGMSNYSWSATPLGATIMASEGNPILLINSVKVIWPSPGEKTLSVSYQPAVGGCRSLTITKSITIHSLPPAPILITNSEACRGGSVIYTTDPGKSNYYWNSGGSTITSGGTSVSNTMTIISGSYSPSSNSVTVGYPNEYGCFNYTSTSTNVLQPPTPTITPQNSTVCQGSSGNIYTTQAGMSNYAWSIPPSGIVTAGGTATDNTVTVTWNTSGDQQISVLYTDPSHGCRAQWTVPASINVKALFAPSISRNTGCLGSSNYYYTDSGMSNYLWSVSGGTIASGGTSGNDFVAVTWNGSGPKSVSVNYINPNGCQTVSPTTNSFFVSSQSIPSLLGSLSICPTHSNPYYTDAITYSTDPGMSDYIWWFDGSPDLYNTSNSILHTWQSPGTHTVQTIYTDINGCVAIKSSRTVTVGTNFDQVVQQFNPIPSLSYGDNYDMIATSSSGLPVAYSSSNTSVINVSGTKLYVVGLGTAVVTASQPGNSCYKAAPSVSQSLTITTKANQTITFGALTSRCANTTLTLSAISNSGLPITYSSSDPSIVSITGNTLTAISAGTVNITATQIGNVYYNPASVLQSITVYPAPSFVVQSNLPTTFCQSAGHGVNLFPSTYFASYLWSNGESTYSISAQTSGTYTLKCTNWDGCSTISPPVTITVIPNSGGGNIVASAPCYDGNNSVTLSTVPAGTNYVWSNGTTVSSINTVIPGFYGASTATYQVSYKISGVPATACYELDPCISVRTSQGSDNPKTEINGNEILAFRDKEIKSLLDRQTTNGNSFNLNTHSIDKHELELKEETNNQIEIFPNPADKEVTILFNQVAGEDISIKLFDTIGKLYNHSTIGSGLNSVTLDIQNLAVGIYIVQIGSGNASVKKKLIIVK